MTTAFVLSGGASLGAVQVGMLKALIERGITPDLLIGTSAGAMNAAFLAGRGVDADAVEQLAQVWRPLHRRKLFRPDPRRALGAFLGRSPALFSDSGLRELIVRHLEFVLIQDAAIPLQVVTTDLLSGEEVTLDSGPAMEAILASCAIPGMLAPVRWKGRNLVDGGLADNTAISQAVRAGADQVYVLPAGYPCALREPPRTPLGTLAQAMALLVHQRLLHDIKLYAGMVDLVVIPQPCPLAVHALDFGHADELIRRSYLGADRYLETALGRRDDPAPEIGFHKHTFTASGDLLN
jgi:NTE family protein